MTREEVFKLIDRERDYQKKWTSEFDDRNTINDWVAYIVKYLGRFMIAAGTGMTPPVKEQFREQMVKVAALTVAFLEREEYAPRHYDVKEAA